MWIDTHCHLDAPEFADDVLQVRADAARQGVMHCVIPAVQRAHWEAVRTLAHQTGDSYCLGIHPLYVPQAADEDLLALDQTLNLWRDDPRLVAVGEIGLDFFVPALQAPAMRARQEYFYRRQLVLARKYQLPVVLHVRRSADRLLKYLREVGGALPWQGIAHAFNGSDVQAQAFRNLGLCLGFGGAMSYERAHQLRRLAQTVPIEGLVLETDAPDIPPHWLYATAQQREQGMPQGRNAPAELPRIGAVLAQLREMHPDAVARATTQNACAALPRLRALLV